MGVDAALDYMCETLKGLQLKENLANFTEQHEWLRHPDIEGMPKTIGFAVGSPFPGKGPLLFLGFTKESWPKKSPLHEKGRVARENRFSPLQHQNYIDIRNEFYELVREAKRQISGSMNDAKTEESVELRAQCVRKFWASHPPEFRFSTCRAVSFPDFIIRQKCVICKATSNGPRDEDSSLEEDLRDPQSLKWHIKKDNFDCAEIMAEAGYEDLLNWSDAQQRKHEGTPTHLMLAPPKSPGT